MIRSKRAAVTVLLAILGAGVLLRCHEPVSRPSQWAKRSHAFQEALAANDWRGTHRSYHPGFTVMALGALGFHLEERARGTRFARIFDWMLPPTSTRYGRRVAAGIIPLAVVAAIAHAFAASRLAPLGGWEVALVAAGFLAFTPFMIAQGAIFHPDALMSALMLASAVSLLVGLERRRRSGVLASGVLAGLALLTKTPSLFLFPFAGLSFLVHGGLEIRRARAEGTPLSTTVRHVAAFALVWGAGVVVPLATWPALWVDPIGVGKDVLDGIRGHVENPHGPSVYFGGHQWAGKPPGALFYPAALLFDTSFTVLSLTVVSILLVTRSFADFPLPRRTFWLLVAFVVFFVIQMSLASKMTGGRYLMPVHGVLAVLAAAGWVGLARAFAKAWSLREGTRTTVTLGVILVELALAWPYRPDYGGHHNLLLGGNRVAERVIAVSTQNEGVHAVADFVNEQRPAGPVRFWSTSRTWVSLRQFVSEPPASEPTEPVDLRIFDLASVQRGLDQDLWKPIWDSLLGRPPAFAVSIDGVDFFRVYATEPGRFPSRAVVRGWGLPGTGIAWLWVATLIGMAYASRRALREPEPHSIA